MHFLENGFSFSPDRPYLDLTGNEFTSFRLSEVYRFTQTVLSAHSRTCQRDLTHLDIGTWNGNYLHYLLECPGIEKVHAIDINPAKVERAQRRPELQNDLSSGRLSLSVMDGTDTCFEDCEVDSITSVEVMVALKGSESNLFREMNRLLRPGGVAVITFADKGIQNIVDASRFSRPKGEAYDPGAVEEMIKTAFGEKVQIDWFGQMPVTYEPNGVHLSWSKGEAAGSLRIFRETLEVQRVYDEEGKKLNDPHYWVGVITKPK